MNWEMLLPAVELANNSAVSEDLGTSPFGVDVGWGPHDPLEVLQYVITHGCGGRLPKTRANRH